MKLEEALAVADQINGMRDPPENLPPDVALIKLAAEVRRLQVSHRRYETLRRLNVVQFKDLFERSIRSYVSFDSLVDELAAPPGAT